MAQSKEELISRQELLQVITDHTAKLGDTAPLQVAVLAWVKQLVEAMPAKAVQVELVRCADCKYWTQTAVLDGTHTIGCCNFDTATASLAHDYCSNGIRRADHGKD